MRKDNEGGIFKMAGVAFIFAGQGSQYVSMGKDLFDGNETVHRIYEAMTGSAEEEIKISFNGPEEELKRTRNTQVALYVEEIAIANALLEKGIKPDALAGFSLGEVSALSFSGAFDMMDGLGIVKARASAMEDATRERKSIMDAVLRLPDEKVEDIASSFIEAYPVNYNAPGQVVVALREEDGEKFEAEVTEAGGMTMRLNVAGGFHSPFMKSASEKFEKELGNFKAGETVLPVYANLTGRVYPGNVKDMLVKQMVNPVRWTDTVRNMIGDGIDTFVEIGPGRTLSSLVKRIDRSVKTLNVSDTESFDRVLSSLGGV